MKIHLSYEIQSNDEFRVSIGVDENCLVYTLKTYTMPTQSEIL